MFFHYVQLLPTVCAMEVYFRPNYLLPFSRSNPNNLQISPNLKEIQKKSKKKKIGYYKTQAVSLVKCEGVINGNKVD